MRNNKVINNAKWIIICKAAQAILQLVIGMLSARYLGPSNYGLINYAKSIVAFVLPITQLGLSTTLVREFVEQPHREGEIMGTSLLMSFLSSLTGIFLVTGFISVANRGEMETLLVCLLYSISLLFQAIELIRYWFHYKLQSKIPSLMMLVAYLASATYKIFLLASGKSVYWFALAYALECGVVGLSLLVIYRKNSGQTLRVSLGMAKSLFSRSRYYILSALMVTLFQNTDHVMLTLIAGDVENGIYTAAITCAGIGAFVYAAIIDSARPMILSYRKEKDPEYPKSLSKLYCIIVYLSLLQGIVFALLAKPIVLILYGQDYADAVPVLQILVWYLSFSQMGRIRNIWILAEEKQKILWKINLAGALANAGINALLIPVWGAAGAAFASLVTQVFTNFVLGFVLKQLRENNRLLLNGISPAFFLSILRDTFHKMNTYTRGNKYDE